MLEFITEQDKTDLALTDDQITKLTEKHNEWLPTIKKDWDGKASKDADGILDSIAKAQAEKYGYTVPRAQGEKYDDYLAKLDEHRFGSLKSDYESKKSEYDRLVKDFDGGKAQKAQIEQLAGELDQAKQKLANFDELSEKANKADEFETKYNSLKQSFAYTQVKPTFPDTVNPYEAKAKYDAFIEKTNEKYHIVIDESNVAWAVSKENEHSKKKLSELVSADKELTELAAGRQQQGTGARENKGNVAGLEIDIPIGAERSEASRLINAHLDAKKLTGEERTAEFTKLWAEWQKATKEAA